MSKGKVRGSEGAVRVDEDYLVIRIPFDKAHSLRVALAPCPCRAPKSHATERVRESLAKALARATAKGGGQ